MGSGDGRGDLSPELGSRLVVTSDDSCPPCKMGLSDCGLCYTSKIQLLAREAQKTGRKSGKSL